jgi:hypothetical protein
MGVGVVAQAGKIKASDRISNLAIGFILQALYCASGIRVRFSLSAPNLNLYLTLAPVVGSMGCAKMPKS